MPPRRCRLSPPGSPGALGLLPAATEDTALPGCRVLPGCQVPAGCRVLLGCRVLAGRSGSAGGARLVAAAALAGARAGLRWEGGRGGRSCWSRSPVYGGTEELGPSSWV